MKGGLVAETLPSAVEVAHLCFRANKAVNNPHFVLKPRAGRLCFCPNRNLMAVGKGDTNEHNEYLRVFSGLASCFPSQKRRQYSIIQTACQSLFYDYLMKPKSTPKKPNASTSVPSTPAKKSIPAKKLFTAVPKRTRLSVIRIVNLQLRGGQATRPSCPFKLPIE